MASKIAKEKVWANPDGELVKDGDPNAAVLVAVKGQVLPDKRLSQYENAGKFFDDLNPKGDKSEKPAPPKTHTAPAGKSRVVAKPE